MELNHCDLRNDFLKDLELRSGEEPRIDPFTSQILDHTIRITLENSGKGIYQFDTRPQSQLFDYIFYNWLWYSQQLLAYSPSNPSLIDLPQNIAFPLSNDYRQNIEDLFSTLQTKCEYQPVKFG